MWDLDPTWLTYEYTQLGSCHGPAGGAPAAGAGGGVSAERIPRGTPPHLARRGEISTKTQDEDEVGIAGIRLLLVHPGPVRGTMHCP